MMPICILSRVIVASNRPLRADLHRGLETCAVLQLNEANFINRCIVVFSTPFRWFISRAGRILILGIGTKQLLYTS